MTAQTAVQFARSLREAQVRQHAQDRFPGIERLEERSVDPSEGGVERLAFVGSWRGVWLEFAYSHGKVTAHVVAQCRCCHRYTRLSRWGQAIEEAAALAVYFDEDPPAFVEQCYGCKWLHERQVAASQATSRMAQFLFKTTRGETVAAVLARHPARV